MPLISCPHAEDVGKQSTVHCTLERFGGFPHLGVCQARCEFGRSQATKQAIRLSFAVERAKLCEACGETCPLKGLSSCQRMARLKAPGMACPVDRWKPV